MAVPIAIGSGGSNKNRGVAERSNAAVLKTVEPQGSGGSNPSSSALPDIALAKLG